MAEQQHVGIGAESTYGTAVAPTDFLEGVESADVNLNKEVEEISTIRAHSVRIVNLLNERVAGTVICIGNYQELGLIFKHFWGAATTSGAGPFTHTFPGSSGIPDTGRIGKSLTIEIMEASGLATRYAGCKVTQIRISADANRSPRIEFTFFGKSAATATPAAFVDPGFNPMVVGDADFIFDGTTLDVTDFDITLSREVDEPFVVGSAAVAKEPRDGKLAATGTCTLLFTDNTQWTKFLNNTDVDVQLAITDGTRALTLNMNKVRLRNHTKPIEAENSRVRCKIDFVSFFDTTTTENVQAILVNNDATIP